VFATLRDNGIDVDGGELLLRRVQFADGRSRAFINDQPVSVQLLRSIGGRLVEIHGQHDNRALLEADSHLGLVDAFAGLGGEVAALGGAWQAWRQAEEKLATHRDAIDQARRDRDYLEHSVAELERLAPRAGEETELADLRQLMMNAEKFTEDLREAEGALAGDGTVEARLNAAMRKLGRAAERAGGRLDAAVGAIDRALAEMAEARGAVAAAIADIEHDPKTLETTEERLFSLRAMARKHSVPVDRLPELLAEMTARLAALASDETTLAALEADVAKAREGYCRKAETLSGQRAAAAGTLDGKVMAELAPLKLEKARFETTVASLGEAGAGPRGWDRAEFMVSANPGTPLGPLRKIASGGELARFMLALKVVLAARGSAPTLIFDEIDTGVGGAVAEAIGVRLARLADGLQVLAVTHSPQVAARADIHMRISKEADGSAADDRVVTRVEALSKDTRREEIARMLAGARVTDEARAAADRLIGSEA
jgi:DNA repair protein RecN (Recombination protein N)